MHLINILKRSLFWLLFGASILLLCIGVFIILRLLLVGGNNIFAALWAVVAFTTSSLSQVVKKSPEIVLEVSILSIFWLSVYFTSLYYLAQEEIEKKLFKYSFPITFIAVITVAVGSFASVAVKLASQSAGN